MSKEQTVMAFIAYHISAGRYGVKNAAGERVGDFIGTKEEAQVEAERLIAELSAPSKAVIVFGGGDTGFKPMAEEELRAYAAYIDVPGHDSLPVDQVVEAVMAKLSELNSSIDLAAGAGGNSAGDDGAGSTGQDAHLLKPSEQLGTLAGVVGQDGNVLQLKDMGDEQLRKLAADMGIDGHADLPIEQLAQLIAGETVVVQVAAYTVNRERLDHDGESYTYGEPIEFADPAQAEPLLKLGAIQESE